MPSSSSIHARPLPIFTRLPRPLPQHPQALAGPAAGLTLRQWQVQCLLYPLPPTLAHLLRGWFLQPARPAWLRDAPPLVHDRPRYDEHALWQRDLATFRHELYDEVRACWQTLDAPYGSVTGLTRNRLLAAHGRRLCQLAAACARIAGAGDAETEFRRVLRALVD